MNGIAIHEDNKGSTFLLVVIAMLFIAALGITVLTIAVNNYQVMTVDQASKMNFYDTEGVVAEIKTGVVEIAGEVFKKEYPKILENYSKYNMDSNVSIQDEFERLYLGNLAMEFIEEPLDLSNWDGASNVGKADEAHYKVETIMDCTPRSPNPVVTPSPSTASDHFLVLDADSSPKKLTLKNVKVKVTTKSGYETLITTDLVFEAPNIEFDMEENLEYANYILMGNQGVAITNGTVDVKGNVYSGPDGFQVMNGAAVHATSETFLSRGALNVHSFGAFQLSANNPTGKSGLWVEDVTTTQIANLDADAVIHLKADCYVSDDLELNAKHSDVTIEGDYWGYNYNYENQLTYQDATASEADELSVPGSRAEYSSAILINGMNSKLDMSGVKNLQLAGRAYISRGENVHAETGERGDVDILTGESFALKSNQIAYLVPNENIDLGTNPVNAEEAERTASIDPITGRRTQVHFKASDLVYPYLTGEDKKYEEYYFQGLDGEVYVYYFLRFLNEEKANEYMEKYYGKNKVAINNRAAMYMANPVGKSTFSFGGPDTTLKVAGLLFNFNKDGAKMTSGLFKDTTPVSEESLRQSVGLAKNYMSYVKYLVPSKASTFRWTDEADKNGEDPLFGEIMEYDAIRDELAGLDGYEEEFTLEDGTSAYVRIYDNEDDTDAYELVEDHSKPNFNRGVLVATGDVDVHASFEGIILSNGKINVFGNWTLAANEDMVCRLLDQVAEHEDLRGFFQGIRKKRPKDGEENDWIKTSVSFQNWSKNDSGEE